MAIQIPFVCNEESLFLRPPRRRQGGFFYAMEKKYDSIEGER
jgi:hypothetical protein